MLNLLPEGDDELVQLVHEIFRSFILNASNMCALQFSVIKEKSHGHVVLQYLKDLKGSEGPKFVLRYSILEWPKHLVKATQEQELLVCLYQFFNSDGVKMWLSTCLKKDREHTMFFEEQMSNADE